MRAAPSTASRWRASSTRRRKWRCNGFDDNGNLLPLITTKDGGPEEAGDKNIMTYSFRLCLTADPKNRVPMPEPDHYDPARFEIVRRYLKAGGDGNQVGFDLYPLPGGKLDGNNSIGRQFSIGLVGGGTDWHAADEAGRNAIWEAHKQYTLEFIPLPDDGPCRTQGSPQQVRSARPMQGRVRELRSLLACAVCPRVEADEGMYVISQKDILDEPTKDDPIAISSFPIDSHDCQRIASKGGGVINEGTIFPVRKAEPEAGLRVPRTLSGDPAQARAV